MNFHVLTLFPQMITDGFHTSITGRAMDAGLLSLETVDIRDYSNDKHFKVDDYTYGGGAGLLMKAGPVVTAYEDLVRRTGHGMRTVYLSPQGSVFTQKKAAELAKETDTAVDILPGMSFVEVMYTRLGIDPIEGLTILDAEDVSTLKERPAQSLVITQVYDPIIASDTKLMLMEFYPDEYEVTYIHNLALPDESIRKIPLYELDRQKDVDHLTSLFVPAQ